MEARRSFREVKTGTISQPKPGSGWEKRLAASDLYEEVDAPEPTVKDLKAQAREAGIEGVSSMNKQQLIDALAEVPTAEGEGERTEEPTEGSED